MLILFKYHPNTIKTTKLTENNNYNEIDYADIFLIDTVIQ